MKKCNRRKVRVYKLKDCGEATIVDWLANGSRVRGRSLAAALLRSLCDLVLQVTGFVIAAELAQRRFVQLKENFAQFFGFGIAGCEALPINLTQRADKSVAVFVADFAVLVAVAIVETCLAHGALQYAEI